MEFSEHWAIRRRNGGIDANDALLNDPRLVGDEYGEWVPVEMVERADQLEGAVEHDEAAHCPECGHATVGWERPWHINHAAGCSMPQAVEDFASPPTRGTVDHAATLAQHLRYAIDTLEGRLWTGWNTDVARDALDEYVRAIPIDPSEQMRLP